ncbi:unnamed protein product [Parajaminaea phylloscopi]
MDHLEGLATPIHNASPIYCSTETKEMLLRLEPGPSRAAGEIDVPMGVRGRKRPYEWLKVTQQEAHVRNRHTGSRVVPRDLLHALPLNTPTEIPYLPGRNVRITLLDANHMPGAVMFLIEGHRGTVLHMGDCRAEKWWLEALTRHPSMQRYVACDDEVEDRGDFGGLRAQAERLGSTQVLTQASQRSTSSRGTDDTHIFSAASQSQSETAFSSNHHLRLTNIYIDDEAVGSAEWPMTKKDAALEVISLMRLYPPDTVFFVDTWTWGFETLLIAIGKSFQVRGRSPQIHVDRYKKAMYTASSDPVAPFLTTRARTRFHACERHGECSFLSGKEHHAGKREAFESLSQHWDGPAPLPLAAAESLSLQQSKSQRTGAPLVVYVKPIASSKSNWASLSNKLRRDLLTARDGRGEFPLWLACPINRHSVLPELQRFVKAFRPLTVTPTTSNDSHYFLIAKYLGPVLGPNGQERVEREAQGSIGIKHWRRLDEIFSQASAAHPTVVSVLRAFKDGLRQTLDLSQTEPPQPLPHDDGYIADVSGVPADHLRYPNLRPEQSEWARRRKVGDDAAINTDPAGADGIDCASSDLPPSSPTRDQCGVPPTELDEDLARRYFIVLRMFIEPGLRLRNLPGGTEGPQAWRAVRKLRPDYARATEETMRKELGVVPPPWNSSSPCIFASHSVGVNADQTVEAPKPWAPTPSNLGPTQAPPRVSLPPAMLTGQLAPQPDAVTEPGKGTALTVPPQIPDKFVTAEWITPLIAGLKTDWSDLPNLGRLSCAEEERPGTRNSDVSLRRSAALVADEQAALFKQLLKASLHARDSPILLRQHADIVCSAAQSALGAVTVLLAQTTAPPVHADTSRPHLSHDVLSLLVKIIRMGEMAARLCSLLLAPEARGDALKEDKLRASLRASVSATQRLVRSHQEGLLGDAHQREQSSTEEDASLQRLVAARLSRMLVTLQFAKDEATQTSLPPVQVRDATGVQEGAVQAALEPPHPMRSIHDPAERLLRFNG